MRENEIILKKELAPETYLIKVRAPLIASKSQTSNNL